MGYLSHRIIERTRQGMQVEITAQKRKHAITTEYLLREIGLQCEAYSLAKPEGEVYASPWDDCIRYVCTVDPRTNQVSCDCWGWKKWHGCKHAVTVARLRDEAEIGPARERKKLADAAPKMADAIREALRVLRPDEVNGRVVALLNEALSEATREG